MKPLEHDGKAYIPQEPGMVRDHYDEFKQLYEGIYEEVTLHWFCTVDDWLPVCDPIGARSDEHYRCHWAIDHD